MRSAVILDLDGTLVNSLPDIRAALNQSLSLLSLPTVGEDECRHMVGSGARVLTERAAGERQELREELYRLYRAAYSSSTDRLTRPYPGIPEALRALKKAGLRLCVISNKDQRDAERVLGHCFPGFSFDMILGRQPGLALKPDAAPGLRCLNTLLAPPGEAVVVGDSGVDVAFAAALSCPSVGCAWGFRGEKELIESGCTRLCRAPDELVPLILSL